MITIHSLKNILIVLLIVVLFFAGIFFIKDWLRPRIITALVGYTSITKGDTITEIDIQRDTVFIPKVQHTEATITEPKTKDPASSTLNGKNPQDFSSIQTYDNPINDTLIEGFITTDISRPSSKILTQSLHQKPKFPIIVTETKTVTKIVETILENKPKAYLGIGIIGTNTNQVGASLLYQTPKKWQIQTGYLIPINKTDVTTPKQQIAISIHKLF